MDKYAKKHFNRSFFIFPVKIKKNKKFKKFLAENNNWNLKKGQALRVEQEYTPYLLCYVKNMLNNINKLNVYEYTGKDNLNINMLTNMEWHNDILFVNHKPLIEDITLYVFGTDIAFLEFNVSYENLSIDEITTFAYAFRSLRYDEKHPNNKIPEGEISLKKAINEFLLPHENSGANVCFSNQSGIKQQAEVFTIIDTELFEKREFSNEEVSKWCYWLSHGINQSFGFTTIEMLDKNELRDQVQISPDTIWTCSQEGMACITTNAHAHMFRLLTYDYHFMYLILLNQRFSTISYIDEIAECSNVLAILNDISKKVLVLRAHYSFSIISDDSKIQNIYSKMFNVLHIDNLMKNVEDANEGLMEMHAKQVRSSDRWRTGLLTGISVLAVFSALIDLSSYLDLWGLKSSAMIISLCTNITIIIAVLVVIWKKSRKR